MKLLVPSPETHQMHQIFGQKTKCPITVHGFSLSYQLSHICFTCYHYLHKSLVYPIHVEFLTEVSFLFFIYLSELCQWSWFLKTCPSKARGNISLWYSVLKQYFCFSNSIQVAPFTVRRCNSEYLAAGQTVFILKCILTSSWQEYYTL